jgi:nucleotide-binding universal stress UspA family protein
MIKRILVGLGDRVYAGTATRQAIRFAQQFGAEVAGVTLCDFDRLEHTGPVPIGAGGLAVELREHRVEQMRQALEAATAEFEAVCGAAGVPHRLLDGTGDPFEGLISHSRYYDLIVCGLKNLFGHGVVEEPPIELERLVEGGVRPLVAVTDQDREVRRVLIAYSGSIGSAKTMKRFVQSRVWPDAALRIVAFKGTREDGHALLAAAAEYCHAHGFSPETETIDEHPKNALLPYAKDHLIDAIVLGNSARSLLMRRVFGETALHVMRAAECPLFLCQ